MGSPRVLTKVPEIRKKGFKSAAEVPAHTTVSF